MLYYEARSTRGVLSTNEYSGPDGTMANPIKNTIRIGFEKKLRGDDEIEPWQELWFQYHIGVFLLFKGGHSAPPVVSHTAPLRVWAMKIIFQPKDTNMPSA